MPRTVISLPILPLTEEHTGESSQQPTRETTTGGGASCVRLEYGWASPQWTARKREQMGITPQIWEWKSKSPPCRTERDKDGAPDFSGS